MRTNAEIIQNVLQKTKRARKKRYIKTAILSASVTAILAFLVAFSNIIPVNASLYPDSYKNYLVPYVATDFTIELTNATESQTDETEETDVPKAALRFINKNNAVVSIGSAVFPCQIHAESKKQFRLDVIGTSSEISSDAKSVFHVEFWEENATLYWEINGIKFLRINLSIAEERQIPTGLWVAHAMQSPPSEPKPVSGSNWTLILENGNSYVGEGSDVYISKFLSVNNLLFHCMFDSKSGLLLDATLCVYDTETFEFPTLKERFLSDEDEYYQYSKLVPESERVAFTGATFNAVGVTREASDFRISENELPNKDVATWRLFPYSSSELSTIDVRAKLQLNADGTAKLNVSGNLEYNDKVSGKWYPLHRLVLVVLNENTALTGKAFTLYAGNAHNENAPTQEELERTALSYLNRYDFYKVGYHVFQYRVLEEEIKIFWGNAWQKEFLIPKLIYEQPYVLNGKYLPSYYDKDAPATLTPMLDNGNITLVFHKNNTVTVTYLDTGETKTITFIQENGCVEFSEKINLQLSETVTQTLDYLNVMGGYLELEFIFGTNSGHYTFKIYRFDLAL